ncbi:MAG TPA: class I SAM-dependent methyltransferase [Ktedonobacterales bacterium]|nr:class I SAM-dependent methyltransferase [Ktedonobacterales bacterium]
MQDWDRAIQSNRELWNELTEVHAGGAYDVDDFRSGKKQLDPLVRSEIGDVAGKSLLHLQCHFGVDTLMWARLGAQVTGADLSPDAIALARKLGDELGLPATFVESNLYDLPNVLQGEFDIVYTSWGVLGWLPDLATWGQIIAHYLKPGGFFYIAETHPFLNVFYDGSDATGLRVEYTYFYEPRYEANSHDYASGKSLANPMYLWRHSLGEVVNALAGAGLRIDFLHEHPFLSWPYVPFMIQDAEGWYRLPSGLPGIPLSFSIKATKAGS